jgi:hypothetical protein
MSLSLADIETISNVATRIDANPVLLLGRFFGLSAEEQRAGVPTWGWIALGVGVAVAGGLLLHRKYAKNSSEDDDEEEDEKPKKRVKKRKNPAKRSKMFRVVRTPNETV